MATGSQAQLGQRRSSVTPLGTSSLKTYAKNDSSKINIQPESSVTPHKVFVELDQLCNPSIGVYEWKQKARWIKFEENVEEGANRWGKPHVSSLSFHSLLDLKKCIEQGAVLLDVQETTIDGVVNRIVDELHCMGHVKAERIPTVTSLLLEKHMTRRRNSVTNSQFTGNKTNSKRRTSLLQSLKLSDKDKGGSPYIERWTRIPTEFTPNGSPASIHNQHIINGSANANGSTVLPFENGDLSDKYKDVGFKYNIDEGFSIMPRKLIPDPLIKSISEDKEMMSVQVGQVNFLDRPLAAFIRLSDDCCIDSYTGVPTRFIFVLLGPSQTCLDYYETGRVIGTLMSTTYFGETAYKAQQREDLLKGLSHFLDESIVLPRGGTDDENVLLPIVDIAKQKEQDLKEKSGKKEDESEAALPFDPFKRTSRPFGGLVNDIKFRFPLYWTDIKDGLNLQSLAAFFFIYFACLTPAITFGGLLSDKTDQWIGVSEMIFGSFILGVLHSSFGGQPLMIIGGSAPLLVFEEALYKVSNTFGLDFMSFRFWVSSWNAIFTVIVIAVEGIFLVKYVTGFTKDVFAMLIPLIFIIETFIKINKYFVKHPLEEEYPLLPDDFLHNTTSYTTIAYPDLNSSGLNVSATLSPNNILDSGIFSQNGQPNTALFSMILTLGTFAIADYLRGFKAGCYLNRTLRNLISNFGVPIAVFIMVGVDLLVEDVYTEKLNVPDGVTPTDASKRGWFINPMGHTKSLPVWAIFAAIIPGLLLFILLFMEVLITSMIVNKQDRRLKKGPGYNIDMLLIGSFTVISGLFGLPYLSVPIVRCIAQIQALEVFNKSIVPGEKPKFEKVQEHRLVNFFVHVMMGLSTLLGPVLREIPIAVLFGVFLFMGVSALKNGNNLFDRVLLMFKHSKHHPNVGFVTKVRTWRMHLYTFLQLCCLGILWAVKSTKAALGFPFVLIILVPFRLFIIKHVFHKEELLELDSDTRHILSSKEKRLKEQKKNMPNLTAAL